MARKHRLRVEDSDQFIVRELQKKIDELNDQIKTIDEEVRDLLAQRKALARAVYLVRRGKSIWTPEDVPHQTTYMSEIREFLVRERRPMRIAEIVDYLEQKELPPSGAKNRYNSVHQNLLRRPQIFRRVARGLWGLVGHEYPESK